MVYSVVAGPGAVGGPTGITTFTGAGSSLVAPSGVFMAVIGGLIVVLFHL